MKKVSNLTYEEKVREFRTIKESGCMNGWNLQIWYENTPGQFNVIIDNSSFYDEYDEWIEEGDE